jgi:hypothetical protein
MYSKSMQASTKSEDMVVWWHERALSIADT